MLDSNLLLERRDQQNKSPMLRSPGGATLMLSPSLDEDYWAYRVVLTEQQAIVGFPKFSTIGIGFAVEGDGYNTNLPYSCDADEIYDHIADNKGDDSITRERCVEAIRLVQVAVAEDRKTGTDA